MEVHTVSWSWSKNHHVLSTQPQPQSFQFSHEWMTTPDTQHVGATDKTKCDSHLIFQKNNYYNKIFTKLLYRLPQPQTGLHLGLSGPSSGLNTARLCKDQHRPWLLLGSRITLCTDSDEKGALTQLSQQGSVATRRRTGRGSLSWSAALLGTGRWRWRCPPGNTNSPRKQLLQIRHL